MKKADRLTTWLGAIAILAPLGASAQTADSTMDPTATGAAAPGAVVQPQTPAPPTPPPMPPAAPGAVMQPNVLDQVFQDVRKAYGRQERPVVVFDLEGTLFDNRPRILQILKEYANQEVKKYNKKMARQLLANLSLPMIQYDVATTLRSTGITEDFVNNGVVFWSERFYTSEYLQYDEPVAGGVAFVRKLYSSGARIVYLTGRDAQNQLVGTTKILQDKGFPIGIQGTELIMKPVRQMQDAIFKQQVTAYLRGMGKIVATFDNEPANANVYKRAFKEARVVLFQAPHTPNPPPPLPGIQHVANF